MTNVSPIVVHLIYRFDIGGLERVMINCIKAMQTSDFKHVVIALTDVGEFSEQLKGLADIYQLNKKSGKDLGSHWRLFSLLRKIKPQVLHTYNLAAIEYHPIARIAGVKGHIHAEHGRDHSDPEGLNKKHNLLRKLMLPFIDFVVPVSTDLAQWLDKVIAVPKQKNVLIRNGINTDNFIRNRQSDQVIRFIHVARLDPVKDQKNLLKALALTIKASCLTPDKLQLTLVGDGPQMATLKALALDLNIDGFIDFTGACHDVAKRLANADVFVLSSIAEGIPMTVLEAMASSLPVISTNVGGLAELITNNENGFLVEKQNSQQLSEAMTHYINHHELITEHGNKAKTFIDANFSEKNMVDRYVTLYQQSLGQQ